MIELTSNGKSVQAKDIEEALHAAALDSVKRQLHDRFSALRDPDTGEFPTVIVDGASLDELQIRVEGSTKLLALIGQTLSTSEESNVTFIPKPSPRAFLSYAQENRTLAERIAKALQANGIDTWWAEWEIRAGDSLRRKIDEGLGQCTHFIVLLTQDSVSKPWVNQEMDAGLVRKLTDGSAFIPLRCGLSTKDLPPLLSGLLSPSVDETKLDLKQLVADIHGITRKPPVAAPPSYSTPAATGYSTAATAIAEYFIAQSPNALLFDTQCSISDLMKHTGLSEIDTKDALHELGSLIRIHHGMAIAEDELYVRFDSFWKEWDPSKDALRVAADLVNDKSFPSSPRQIAELYGWPPRRLNPAIALLFNRKAILGVKGMDGQPFCVHLLHATDDTRRFVRSRS
jgi:hypothetical protein